MSELNEWFAEAPANIALVKYMGKLPGNLAVNPSLSYSSSAFKTEVSLRRTTKSYDFMEFDNKETLLDAKESKRFLDHLKYIKCFFGYDGFFSVISKNNFPPSCGLASSASSFAALTLAASKAITEIKKISEPSMSELASLSRNGSGSSCRSFFSPWSIWEGEQVKPLKLDNLDIDHYVVVVTSAKKLVSSSEAHLRVRSSSLFAGRVDRAKSRLELLVSALGDNRWRDCYNLVWADFWDMHAMFETSTPGFGYMTADTMTVLSYIRNYWHVNNDGPLITLDAGPNIHLLFRQNQIEIKREILKELKKRFKILG
ncbi:MAG: diphosphomevalonate decarboxylase [Pseudomonadota bacterium]|nr:diphosphomevalonate decarboxylase [Pseudomonadota bacterium]